MKDYNSRRNLPLLTMIILSPSLRGEHTKRCQSMVVNINSQNLNQYGLYHILYISKGSDRFSKLPYSDIMTRLSLGNFGCCEIYTCWDGANSFKFNVKGPGRSFLSDFGNNTDWCILSMEKKV